MSKDALALMDSGINLILRVYGDPLVPRLALRPLSRETFSIHPARWSLGSWTLQPRNSADSVPFESGGR